MNNETAFVQMKNLMELRGFAKSTQKSYLNAIRQLSAFFPIQLKDMSYEHVREFLLHAINERKLSSQYINTTYSGIKFLFEVVLLSNWNMSNIPRLRKKHTLPNILTKDEVNLIINSTSSLKYKAIFSLIYSSGLRVSEVANLKISDVNSKNMTLFIYQGKGSKDRYAILSEKALIILRDYYKESKPVKWLFQSSTSNSTNPKPISTRAIQNVFQKSKNIAGISKNASPHTFRHSFATHLVENGANLIKVKELLGHDKIETTMVYIHLANKDILSIKSPFDI